MRIKSVVFDLDGVIYLGDKVVEGALEIVAALLGLGYQVFYLTNNSSKSQQEIIHKLNRLGFGADARNTYCASYATALYLAEKKIKSAYVVGSIGLCDELVSHGVKMERPSVASAVVVGFDPDINYNKIAMALDAIRNGAKLVVANDDPNYPGEGGKILPGCGAMVGAVLGAIGHSMSYIHVGKPNVYMLQLLCKEHGLSAKEICVVGDMPESDIQMAINFRCRNILFDPDDAHKAFSGVKVKHLSEIISLIK